MARNIVALTLAGGIGSEVCINGQYVASVGQNAAGGTVIQLSTGEYHVVSNDKESVIAALFGSGRYNIDGLEGAE